MSSKTLLYQFALSHYCEKARWGLDDKGIDYHTVNLIPGPHLLTTKRLGPKSSVPILVYEGKVIQDSTEILTFLDELYPEHSLTPEDENLKKEALELEEYFDQEVGVHLRRFFYFHLLENRALVSSLLLRQAPRYGQWVYALAFPGVKALMKKAMNIYEEPTKRSEVRLREALENLNRRVERGEFLVGDRFSRADLAAASLLAPLCMPPEHEFKWPEVDLLPPPLVRFRKEFEGAPFFQWVLKIYREHRRKKVRR